MQYAEIIRVSTAASERKRLGRLEERHGSCSPSDHQRKEPAMWFERWYQRMKMKRRVRSVVRNRAVQIASALAAVAGMVFGMRRWRATRI